MATFLAGMRLRASVLEAAIVRATPLVAYKLSDTTRNATTTAAADPELVISHEAGIYIVRFDLIYSTPGAADIKVGWLPSGSNTIGNWISSWRNADGIEISGTSPSHSTLRTVTATADTPPTQRIQAHGVLTAVAAGTLSVRWAQNTSNAGDTVILAGSTLTATKAP